MKFRLRFLLAASMLALFPLFVAAQTKPPAPTCSIRTTPSTIKFGGSFTLSWISTNATQGAIIGIGNVAPTGSRNTIPTRTTTYTGSFTGAGGSATCSATITINNDSNSINGGGINDVINESPTSPTSGNLPTLTGGEPTGGPTSPVTGGIPNLTGGEPTNSTSNTPAVTNTNTNGSTSDGGSLVPCSGINCQACNFVQLFQKIINFLVGLSIPLAAAMFAWAGILYYTSGIGGEKNISRAKAIFKSSAIGFLLIICAWLGVQTLLKSVLRPEYYQSWNTISCVNKVGARPMNKTINEWLSTLNPLDTSKQQVDSVFNPGGRFYGDNATDAQVAGITCPENSEYNSAIKSCVNKETLEMVAPVSSPFTQTFDNVKGNSGAGTAQWQDRLQNACNISGLADCTFAQAIMANESAGRYGVISPAGAVGLMQVMPGTARGLDPANLSGLSDAEVTQRLKDPDYNMQLGTKYLAQMSEKFNNDPALIAAAYNGGPRANNPSSTCSGTTWWQCSANSGYAETRNYVPKVLSTYNTLKK